MTDVIDSAIDDQNAALTVILIEREWELIPQIGSSTALCVCVHVRDSISVCSSLIGLLWQLLGAVRWACSRAQSHERKQTRFSLVFMLNFLCFFSEIFIWEGRWEQGTRRPEFSAAPPRGRRSRWVIIHTWTTSRLVLSILCEGQ